MILFKRAIDITNHLVNLKEKGGLIGFVPTMGALHRGHLSLLNESKKMNTCTVCSIFVNPTQFNDTTDFNNYPSSLEKDIDHLEKAGCDIVFLPSVSEIYPDGLLHTKKYELGYIETVLEGQYRPGHFQGVCQVVHRLLSIIQADQLYLGQKDYQQCMVIKKLIELEHIQSKINICPTLRETDGLAMSSRNIRLTEPYRKQALKIAETLYFLKSNLTPGDINTLKQTAIKNLTKAGFKVDYLDIARATDLDIIDQWDGHTKTLALVAASIDNVRLIDNMLL